jgi:uncharacterized protein (TIGR00266 family)
VKIVEHRILYKPTYSVLEVILNKGESIEAEAGAFMMGEGSFEIKTKSRGLMRALAGGETLFLNTYIAKEDGVRLWFVPPWPGDIVYVKLDGTKGLIVNDKAYLASHGDVKHKTVWRGLKGVFGGGGLMWLKFEGIGGVWLSAYGSIAEVEVKGQKLTVDNVHLVAMDDTLSYDIKKFGSMKSFLLGGEGFVFNVKGMGRMYLQTRNPAVWFSKRS